MNQTNTTIEIHLQPSGAVLFWTSLGILIWGLVTFSGPLMLLGLIGLLLLPLARWLSQKQLQGLKVTRALPKRVFLGEPFEITGTLINTKKHIHLSDCSLTDGMSGKLDITLVRAGESIPLQWTGRLFRRGWNIGSTFQIRSQWPMGLYDARLRGEFDLPQSESESGIMVMPRPLIPAFLSRVLEKVEQEAAMHSVLQPDQAGEFRTLREFQPGDSVKRIHWPASTRSDHLVVRETDPPLPRPNQYGILLHPYSPPGELVQPERFEVALRITTGLILHFCSLEIPLLVRIPSSSDAPFEVPAKVGKMAVLDLLARTKFLPISDARKALAPIQSFPECDQLFVIGCSPCSGWEKSATAQNKDVICIDPEAVSRIFRRTSKRPNLAI